ncbi:MAG: NAD(+)/NADH kinase, partial [Pyrinomonadaceae bacterium]
MTSRKINSVGIVVKPNHAEARRTAAELSRWLGSRGIVQTGDPIAAGESRIDSRVLLKADLVVVLGGDGTMISTARMIGQMDLLVLGINHGSLGYLTDFRIEEMFPAIEAIISGEYE